MATNRRTSASVIAVGLGALLSSCSAGQVSVTTSSPVSAASATASPTGTTSQTATPPTATPSTATPTSALSSASTPTPTASPTNSTSGTVRPSTLKLAVGAVGAVRLPAGPTAVRREITGVLGRPTQDVTGPGCPLGGGSPKARTITWPGLSVRGEFPPTASPVIDSWRVTRASTAIETPYGISVGSTYAQLKKRVTGLQIDDSKTFSEGFIVFKGDLSWWLNDTNTVVTEIDFNLHICE
jgi:hypothetical protein